MILLNVPYKRQKTKYSCVPASLMMLIEHYTGDCVFKEEEYRYMCNTEESGTYYKKCKNLLNLFGMKLREIRPKRIGAHLASGNPVLVSYMTGETESHCSVIVDYDSKKDLYKLNDPYYGKGLLIPGGTLEFAALSFNIINSTDESDK